MRRGAPLDWDDLERELRAAGVAIGDLASGTSSRLTCGYAAEVGAFFVAGTSHATRWPRCGVQRTRFSPPGSPPG